MGKPVLDNVHLLKNQYGASLCTGIGIGIGSIQ